MCDRHGIVLIFDEVMAGFGRTGKWFACENWDVVPDILTLQRDQLGYVPLGAMIINEAARLDPRQAVLGGLTYSGIRSRARRRSRQSACSARRASSRTPRARPLPRRRASLAAGASSLDRRRARARSLLGLELVRNRETREPLVPFNAAGEAADPVARLTKAALDAGLYLFVHWNVIMLAPPLNITREELDDGLSTLDDALALADEYCS